MGCSCSISHHQLLSKSFYDLDIKNKMKECKLLNKLAKGGYIIKTDLGNI